MRDAPARGRTTRAIHCKSALESAHAIRALVLAGEGSFKDIGKFSLARFAEPASAA